VKGIREMKEWEREELESRVRVPLKVWTLSGSELTPGKIKPYMTYTYSHRGFY
jgi:hypothetical protein